MALSKGNGTLLYYDQENHQTRPADVGLILPPTTCADLQPD
jgi:hypothetical protein